MRDGQNLLEENKFPQQINHKKVKTLAQAQILTHRCTQIRKHISTNSQKKISNYRLNICTYTQVYMQTRSCTQFEFFFWTKTFLCAFYGQIAQDKNNRLSEMDSPESVV